MYVVVVEFEIVHRAFDEFLKRVRQQARDSLEQEPGCHQFDVCRDLETTNRILLYEVYTDKAAFQSHLESDHFLAFNQEVTDWVTGKQISFYERN